MGRQQRPGRRLEATLSALAPARVLRATGSAAPSASGGEQRQQQVAAALHWRSASSLVADIRSGNLLPSQLLEALIARVEGLDGRTNAVIVRDYRRAREQAAAADRAASDGEWWGPLHGLPLTVKDNLDVAGLVTSRGDPLLVGGAPADRSDAAVERLQSAGAIVLGKTNLPLQASDIQSYNEAFGTTNNPHDPSRVPGGSSGGSAAAVAAGLVPAELGTDIGGSLRFPSHCCGVYAHKPTWCLVPKRGGDGTPLAPVDLWVTGPLARCAEDLALLMSVIADPVSAALLQPAALKPAEAATAAAAEAAPAPAPAPPAAAAAAAAVWPGLHSNLRSLDGVRVAVWADDQFCPVGERKWAFSVQFHS